MPKVLRIANLHALEMNGWLDNLNGINNVIPRGTLGLRSIHVAQLITYAALYLIQVLTIQLYY